MGSFFLCLVGFRPDVLSYRALCRFWCLGREFFVTCDRGEGVISGFTCRSAVFSFGRGGVRQALHPFERKREGNSRILTAAGVNFIFLCS